MPRTAHAMHRGIDGRRPHARSQQPDHLRAAAVLTHEGRVDQFDIDAAGHDWFDTSGDLDQLAGGGFGIYVKAVGGILHGTAVRWVAASG